MSRPNDRKLNVSLETLEGRKLQSGVLTSQPAITTIVPNPAVIATPSTPIGVHAYHTVTGFFAQ
jgi:hypothetical protein